MKNTHRAIQKYASALATLAVVIITCLLLPKGRSIGAAPKAPPDDVNAAVPADQKRVRMALGQLPLSFEMNRGQFAPQVQFVSRGAGYKTFLTQTETVFVLRKPVAADAATVNENALREKVKGATPAERAAALKQLRQEQAAQRAASKAVVRMSLEGANVAPKVSGLEELPGKINYFRGNDPQKWITDIPTYGRVLYEAVYPGIDLIYYGGQGRQLEYDLVVAPGADPSRIAFNFEGAERLEVDVTTGALVVHAAGGAQLRQGKPLIYQQVDGSKQVVPGGFNVNGNRAGFTLGEYDRSRPLVIDPAIINYSTYLGGNSNDRGHDIVADADGNAYVVGWTQSEDFPEKNAYQSGLSFDSDEAFITKFNPDGSTLIWSTYLGGSGDIEFSGGDGAYGVGLDADHNVYVTGYTFSSDFPLRNAMQTHKSDIGFSDSFITKLNAAGNQLIFSTYFGGADGDNVGRGIALDSKNNVYVVGYTDSFVFPTTNPIQGEIDGRTAHLHTFAEHFDAYLAKIDASGQFRIYSTYIGGNLDDVALSVAVDRLGAAYVTGWTESTEVDPSASPTPHPPLFPTTDQAVQKNPGGRGFTRDAFVTKVSPTGSEYLYSTFLGGGGADVGWGIALGTDKSAYVTGYTNSSAVAPDVSAERPAAVSATQDGFPTTANAFQQQNNGGYDAFLTRLVPDGSALIYSTYIGGRGNEGNANPQDPNSECLSCAANYDGAAVAVDLLGNAYITGWTESTLVPAPDTGPINFPTKDAFQPQPGSSPGSSPPNSRDAFVSMFNTNVGPTPSPANASLIYSSFLGGSRRDEGQGIAVDSGGNVYVTGWTNSDCGCQSADALAAIGANDFPTTKGAFQKDPLSGEDGFVVQLVGGSAVTGQGQGFTISGQVTTEDGDPLPGVTITLTKPDNTTSVTTTDAQGTYSFPNLAPFPEDPYTVTPSGGPYVYTPPSREVIITNKNERADFVASFPTPEPTPTPTPLPTLQFTSSNYNVDEEVENNVVLTVTRMGSLDTTSTVHYATHDGTATKGKDYTEKVGDLVFPPGEAVETISVPILDDGTIAEPTSETFDVILTNPTEATLGFPAEAVVTIRDVEPTPTPTPTATPTPTPTPTASPTPTPATQAVNLSTRLFAQTGDNVGIAGFIITGNVPKKVIVRGIGPSLSKFGVPNPLADPTLELRRADRSLVRSNDNWRQNQETEIKNSGIPPTNDLESAIVETLLPGNYTAILAGKDGGTGVGLVEVFDLDQASDSKLANLSTRGFVKTGSDVIIAGVILGNNTGPTNIVVRGIGPSLASFGISNVLADPTLEVHNGDGVIVISNNNWKDNSTQAALITGKGLAPSDDLEAAVSITLPPGFYTAVLAGKDNGTGVGLVEIYNK